MDLLIVSQVYPPDPASVGQHLRDVAQEMVRRGHNVGVVTSGRGYADPGHRYPPREEQNGVDIRRVRLGSMGKRTIAHRVLGGVLFLLSAGTDIIFRRPRSVLVSTSPPFAPALFLLCRVLRIPGVVWVMDLNPAQAVALGRVREGGIFARSFNRLNRAAFQRASRLVAMDEAMVLRIEREYGPLNRSIDVVPPWPHVLPDGRLPPMASRFRSENAWSEKFVVMYSGNHSPANPLDTILDAAERLATSHPDVHFAFVGGGIEKEKVEAHRLPNISSLPYQPFEALEDVLSAADLHVVTMGDAMLGIVHPCKIYGAMAVGRPVLGVAPVGSHIDRILTGSQSGVCVRHGDVDGCVQAIVSCKEATAERRTAKGLQAQEALRSDYSPEILCGRVCDILEECLHASPAKLELGWTKGSLPSSSSDSYGHPDG